MSSADMHDPVRVEVRPDAPHDRNGGVAAAFLAAGLACAVLGVSVVIAAASEQVKDLLTLSSGVGPLSGKTVVPTVAYLLAWPALHLWLRGRDVNLRRWFGATALLVGVGFLGTFPPLFELFGH